jgi:hypothetical protein
MAESNVADRAAKIIKNFWPPLVTDFHAVSTLKASTDSADSTSR